MVAWLLCGCLAEVAFGLLSGPQGAVVAGHVAYVFYSPAAAMALAFLVRRWWLHPTGVGPLRLAVVGGLFGVANLFWPAYWLGGAQFLLVSRVADSTLYLPLVIPGLQYLDKVVETEEAKRAAAAAAQGKRRLRALLGVVLVAVVAIAVKVRWRCLLHTGRAC